MTKWKIIDPGLPDPLFEAGGISRTNRRVECPQCNHQFLQHVEQGCFGGTVEPYTCPKCSYPYAKQMKELEKESHD